MSAQVPPPTPDIGAAYRAIADGAPLPWEDLDVARTKPEEVEALHLLDDIAQAFRANTTAASPRPRNTIFRWGTLEVEALIGSGSYGEVYRAFDPWLGRDVALKLFRADVRNATGLDEARRLARLRHHNVLSVYGCGVHDGCAGLWSELIQGRTLAAAVEADGALSGEEALRIGRDLAQALGIVHAAGLIHGDVKAENVMRESGGRIVLMDFGAGGEQRLLVSQRLISGTPRYLPPEVLDGAPLSTASDIYALGALLFFLLSGRLPYAAADAQTLREAQRRGERPSLNSLRPELDTELCGLVESCIANDPALRPESAAALAAKLSQSLNPAQHPRDRGLPIIAMMTALAALLVAAAVLVWPRLSPPAWDSSVRFLRIEPGGSAEDLAANSTLRVGDRLRLNLRSSRDAYVYVMNEDAAGNATVLFPQEGSNLRNPQPGGVTLQLPGGEGSTLAWEVTADSAREEFVIVTALQSLPELDRVLVDWQRAHRADTDTRSVGAVVEAPAMLIQGDHLRKILAAIDPDSSRVHVYQYRFAHRSD